MLLYVACPFFIILQRAYGNIRDNNGRVRWIIPCPDGLVSRSLCLKMNIYKKITKLKIWPKGGEKGRQATSWE